MDNVCIRGRRGTLHFIRFPTSEMGNFLAFARSKGMANLVTTVCATGGGAFKFEKNFKQVRHTNYFVYHTYCITSEFLCNYLQEVNMNLAKFDELDSLIRGMLYIETTNPRECYYWSHPTDDSKCQKVPYDFSEPYPFLVC